VGEGKIVYAGWNNQGYGNYISIRHNSIYTTNYAHLGKIYVNYGEIIKQGQIIGSVGSTGFSTGPHLHFEMVKNGSKVNPSTVDLPSDKSVSEEKMVEFKEVVKKWQKELEEYEI
jgi:murein DD-endopeptidase MepM/ murein hydrolase activator NlpD